MCCRSCSVKLYIKNALDNDARGPKVTRSLIMQQPAELLPTEVNDKRSHLQHVSHCTMSCFIAKAHYWVVPGGLL